MKRAARSAILAAWHERQSEHMSEKERLASRFAEPPKKFLLFPLQLKFFFAFVLALSPLVGVLVYASEVYHSRIALPPWIAQFPLPTISLGGYRADSYDVFIAVVAAIGILMGLIASEVLFSARVRALRAWLALRQEDGFRSIPAAPSGADELGELGRHLSVAALHFVHAKEENKDLVEQKDLFLTIAAHQLRTPLTGLLWSIESLLDHTTPQVERDHLLTEVEGLLKRMRLTINHILASTDIGEGRFGYVFEKLDIIPHIEKLVADFEPVAEGHGVSISFEHAGGTLPVYADKERISLALFDMISNAVDYTPSGGSVKVSATPMERRLEIAIEDTGIGIAEAELPFLFKKLYRSDRARHVRPDGTGLGLYLARNIVNRHGSEIEVHSVEGQGSRFSFFLDSNKKM